MSKSKSLEVPLRKKPYYFRAVESLGGKDASILKKKKYEEKKRQVGEKHFRIN